MNKILIERKIEMNFIINRREIGEIETKQNTEKIQKSNE